VNLFQESNINNKEVYSNKKNGKYRKVSEIGSQGSPAYIQLNKKADLYFKKTRPRGAK
jgi:hypothetical protein